MSKFIYNTIMLIDDNGTANLVHQHLLKRVLHADDIRTFTNPVNALKELCKELLEGHKSILLLLDMHMPEMNGFEFLTACSLFSDKLESLDVVMLTSSIDDRVLQLCSDHPYVIKAISKPLKENEILDLVTQKSLVSA